MIRTLTYRDLTQAQRARGARKMRESLGGHLSNPFLSTEQRDKILDRINLVGQWEHLQLDVPGVAAAPPPPAPARAPQHHVVALSETMPVKDAVS
jgi:hypothetical protein